MYHIHQDFWKDLLLEGLSEDGCPWDWTTLSLQNSRRSKTSKNQKVKAHILAKSEGIWAGAALVQTLNRLSLGLKAQSAFQDGQKIRPKDRIVELWGDPSEILALERPFLNLAAYVSGIATATHRLVEKVKQACPTSPPRIALTRKTLPGYRNVAIHGVRAGGGFPHRVSLSGGVLIKENHIAAAEGIQNAILGAFATAPHGLKIEVEVRSERELREAVECGAEGVLLDNFTPLQVKAALHYLSSLEDPPFVEVSGGITESNISSYALQGVDILSVGWITHSVHAVDLSLLMKGT